MPNTNYKHQYEAMKKMVDVYQNEVAPGLRAKIEELEKQVPKWIPVTERLPEENQRVLVYHDDGRIRFGINKGGFADVVSDEYIKSHHRTVFSKATHWMNLPTPPKGD